MLGCGWGLNAQYLFEDAVTEASAGQEATPGRKQRRAGSKAGQEAKQGGVSIGDTAATIKGPCPADIRAKDGEWSCQKSRWRGVR